MRELQKWTPEEGEDAGFFSLEDSATGWDQFAVNKEKFGVSTTWDEHIYTTRINPDACGITAAEAERLAREIESGANTTTNIHLLEERGGELDANVSTMRPLCNLFGSAEQPVPVDGDCLQSTQP